MPRPKTKRNPNQSRRDNPNSMKNLIPFKSREELGGVLDPRINVSGAHATNRNELAQAIANFLNGTDPDSGETNLDALIQRMATGQALDRKTLVEYFAGKLPQPIQQKFEGNLKVRFVDETSGEKPAQDALSMLEGLDQDTDEEGGTDDSDGSDD